MEEILAGLGKQVFLLHNVHENEPAIFQTRWVLSYLRGPMTREQIKALMADRKSQVPAVAKVTAVPAAAELPKTFEHPQAVLGPPVLPPGIDSFIWLHPVPTMA